MGRIILLLSLAVFIASCTLPLPGRVGPPTVEDKERSAASAQKERSDRREKEARRLTQELDQLIAAENYFSILQKTETLPPPERMDRSLRDRYLTALNGVLVQAEQMKKDGHVFEAGILFRAAKNHFPVQSALREHVNTTPEKIESNIAACADRLLERGLLEYRAGRFDQAVEIWRAIAEFDPGNEASRQSIETTLLQMKSLQELN